MRLELMVLKGDISTPYEMVGDLQGARDRFLGGCEDTAKICRFIFSKCKDGVNIVNSLLRCMRSG